MNNCNTVYPDLKEKKQRDLAPNHLAKLRDECAISDEMIRARGYRTVTKRSDLAALGFAPSQQLVPALLLPVRAPDGANGLYQIRPDNPRDDRKYEMPKAAKMRIDCPPVCRAQLPDPRIPLWITEGIPKGDALASKGLCAIALLGVWNFKGKNDLGGIALLADLDAIAWNGRAVRIVFDSDVMHKPAVRKALERLTEILQRKGAHVTAVYLPNGENGEKVGVDDYLRTHSVDELENLVTAPRPAPQPAPALIELLDEAPQVMRRPLQIVGDHAYAATWLPIKRTVRESLDSKGNIVRHNPPIEEYAREMFVVRDDGKVFGGGGDAPLSDLGFEVSLPEPLPDSNVMNTKAVQSYRAGSRPDPVETFLEIKRIFDRFLDFNRSLAEQDTMCELSACFVIATWFTEGFNTASYVWATGEKGSGKTQLLSLICVLSYLGQFIQASGSMATLRDLSDYGAFLGFDDAENVANKNFDPDKRNILLSGFRRGSQITVKEPDSTGRGWKTRYVNTFTFRGFTATRKPDDILASRAITLPLVRTSNKSKGDADPLDFVLWDRPPKDLCCNLWQIGLAHLTKMPGFERETKRRAALTGRDLEQWVCVLSVAAFLDSLDDGGALRRENTSLFERLNNLSVNYQSIRSELEAGDITRLVLRAIVRLILPAAEEPFSLAELKDAGAEWVFSTDQITKAAHSLVESEDLDFNLEFTNSRRIGRAVGKLRIEKSRNAKNRGWRITLHDLSSLLSSYSLLKFDTETPGENVIDVTNVTNVTESEKFDHSDTQFNCPYCDSLMDWDAEFCLNCEQNQQ